MQSKAELYDKIADIYYKREKNRFELADEYGLPPKEIYSIAKHRGIEIWDLNSSPKFIRNNELAELYSQRRFNREQLAKKIGITYKKVTQTIKNRGLSLWDIKRKRKEPKKKNIPKTKFFNWKELYYSSDYARMIYDFNK